MRTNSIAYSVDEFSLAFQQSNGNALGFYQTGFLVDIHSDHGFEQQSACPTILENGNSFQERCDEIVQSLYERIAPTLQRHPCYRQWRDWTEQVSKFGMNSERDRFWKNAYEQAVQTLESLDGTYLGEEEWTFETAVADRLLDEGANLYVECLEDLRDSPDEQSLAWLEEAIFHLVAVEEWKLERVES
jgi:hypothetical protein